MGTTVSLPGFTLSGASLSLTGALVAASIQDTGLGAGVVHSDASGNFTSSTVVNADVDAAAAIAGSKISPDFGSQAVVTTGTITGAGLFSTAASLQFATGVSAPKVNQADNTTNSATGQALTVAAQNATGTTATGGNLLLKSGTGTSAAGEIQMSSGATLLFRLTASDVRLPNSGIAQMYGGITIDSSFASPVIKSGDVATNSATGTTLKVQAQNATGTTSNGGDLVLTSGTGTSASGSVKLQAGGTSKLQINDTGIGFLGTAPIAKPTVTGSRGANAALTSLLTALANLGLVTDSSS